MSDDLSGFIPLVPFATRLDLASLAGDRDRIVATATSTPVHIGRTTMVIQTDLTRDDGKLAMRTTQTQTVLQLDTTAKAGGQPPEE